MDEALLTEAYSRGLLPPDQKAAYEEASKRGLIGQKPAAPNAVPAQSAVPQNRWQQLKAEQARPKDNWADTMRQLAAGEYSGLVGSAYTAASRAAGHPVDAATTAPKTPVQAVARDVGTAGAMAYDVLAAMAVETGIPEVGAAIRAYTAAKPIRNAAKLGAAYAGQTSMQQQYGETGQVDPTRAIADAAVGSALGGAPNALMRIGESKTLPNAYKTLKDAVTSRLGPKDQYGTLASMTEKDAANSFNVASQSVRDQEAALNKQMQAAGLDTSAKPAREGKTIQQGIVAKVREFDYLRKQKTAPIYAAAEKEAAQKEAKGQFADTALLQQYIQKHNLDGSLSISDQGTPRKVLDYLGGVPATLARLKTVQKEVSDRLDTMAEGSTEKKVYAGLRDQINATIEQHAPTWAAARAKYEAMSKPINDLLQGGSYTRRASELQDYERRTTPVNKIKFEQNPQEVGRSFVNQGVAGAGKIRTVLGEQGAQDFAKGYFAREIDGKDAKGIIDAADKNSEFLRAFPKLNADLRKVAEQHAFLEGVQKHAMDVIDENFAAGRISTPAQVQSSIRGALDAIDKPGSEKRASDTLGKAMALVRRAGGSSDAGRDMVAGYFADKLTPILDSAADHEFTAEQVSRSISEVATDWKNKKQLLVDAGVLTDSHAKDIQGVMDGMAGFSKELGAQKTLTQQAKESVRLQRLAVDILAYDVFGYKGVLAERGGSSVLAIIKAYRNSAQKIMQRAIKDPVMAQRLAAAFKTQGSNEAMFRQILTYGALPQVGGDQQGEQGAPP